MSTVKWVLDPHHSEILFKVKHLMITTVTGRFTKFNIEVESEADDLANIPKIQFEAEVDSVNTNNENRDKHLRSADFFDSVNYPEIIFSATNFSRENGNRILTGFLTMKGITKEVKVAIEFGGVMTDGQGLEKAGFSIEGKLNRKDFGLEWGAVTETGSVIVSDEVKFQGEIQLTKQAL